MANLDISSRLGKEEMTITITEGKTYTIDNSAETVLKVEEKFKSTDNGSGLQSLYDIIELLIGKVALKEIKEMKPTAKQIEVISLGLMAQVQEVSYEEMEKRFQK